ncbi:MAG: TolC family protein [Bacteroidota bacterium]
MNPKWSFKFLLSLSLFFSVVHLERVSAQDSTKFLSLRDAIANSLQNNQSVQLAQQDEKIANSKYNQTQAIYLPQVGFSYTAMSTNNPLNAFGFKLHQKSITMNDFNPDLLNHPNGTPDFTTKLEVMQPIINMDMWYQKKAAAKQTEIYQFQTERTKEYISFEVQKAYLQLAFAYDAVKVLEDANKTSKAVNKFASDHFEQGLIQKSDVLNTEVHIKMVESNLAKANSNIKNASDYLSFLMHLPTGVIYKVNEPSSGNSIITENGIKLTDSRSDFLAMQKAIEASDYAISSSKKSYLPRLNAFGSYQLNDSRMLGFGANAYLAGLQLSWNIFSGNKTKNLITTQTLELNKLKDQLVQQKDQSQVELNKALRDLNDANFEVKQQEKSIEQASEALRILQNRYEQGLANTTDLLMATTQLSQQQLLKAQAILTSNITKAYIQFLTSSFNK